MGQYGMNKHFVPNMMGKTVAFDVQPYQHGKGKIVKMTPRIVERSDFSAARGRTLVKYEVFDLEIECEEGREVGALWGGVPVSGTIHDLVGKTVSLYASYGEICKAVNEGRIIVRATCG